MTTDSDWRLSRRRLLQIGALATAGSFAARRCRMGRRAAPARPLAEFGYGAVSMASDAHEAQLRNTQSVLMSLSDDSLLMPFRQMAGLPAPGVELGGWYAYRPDYDYRKNFDEGFAPGCHFGQWVSALARGYAITGDRAVREKVLRLNRLYARPSPASSTARAVFPTYTYDKLTIGLLDSHSLAHDPQALAILERTTDTALPHFPSRAVEHDQRWRMDKDPDDASWTWDESYTLPENMFLASERGAGPRYSGLGRRYLDDETLVRSAVAERTCAERPSRLQLCELAVLGDDGLFRCGQRKASARGEKRLRHAAGPELRHRRLGSRRNAARAGQRRAATTA